MQRDRPQASVFDRGPPIETLRANCLAETGLPAPVAPVWHTQATVSGPAPVVERAAAALELAAT
jgi:hypothetical protein